MEYWSIGVMEWYNGILNSTSTGIHNSMIFWAARLAGLSADQAGEAGHGQDSILNPNRGSDSLNLLTKNRNQIENTTQRPAI